MPVASNGDLTTVSVVPFYSRAINRLSRGRAATALLDQALVSGANFFTNVLLARIFGLREYGVFSLAWTALLFANSLQYALVITPMMSVGPKQDPENRPHYFGAVLLHETVLAGVTALTILIGVLLAKTYFPQWRVGDIALPLSAATFAYLLQDYIRRYFFCIGENGWALASDSVSYLVQLPVLVVLGYTGRLTIPSALWIIAATSLAGFVPFLKLYGPVQIRISAVREIWTRHWIMSRWLVPSSFMQWGAGNLFLMAAPLYYGAAASATIRASYNIVGVAHIWFLGLDNVVPAEAARKLRGDGVREMLKFLRRVSLKWGTLTLAFTATVALFPTFWLRLAYGSKYETAGDVLRLFALLYLDSFFSLPLRAGLLALEYTQPIFWAYPVMIVFSMIFAGPLARTFGLHGILLGMLSNQLILQAIVGVFLLIRVKRLIRSSSANVSA